MYGVAQQSSVKRAASHAGSWYAGGAAELRSTISSLMREAGPVDKSLTGRAIGSNVKAIIAPHAGMSYSGATASHAFKKLQGQLDGVRRIFVIGPCHFEAFSDLRLTSYEVYETPLRDLPVDVECNRALAAAAKGLGVAVGFMGKQTDTDEHSVELMLPYLAHLLEEAGSDAKIVPVFLSSNNPQLVRGYARLLAPHFADPETRFVISSDFCHWGSRFRYTHHFDKQHYPHIGDAIVAMDHEGMRLIGERDPEGFTRYLEKTGNTICGRTPINALLEAMREVGAPHRVDFVHYSQSSRCRSEADSSVSYASAVVSV